MSPWEWAKVELLEELIMREPGLDDPTPTRVAELEASITDDQIETRYRENCAVDLELLHFELPEYATRWRIRT